VLTRGKKTLVVVDAAAAVFTRLWCVYEAWLAAVAAPGASPASLQLLNAGADWDALADGFFRYVCGGWGVG
jgi:hypothetical protein